MDPVSQAPAAAPFLHTLPLFAGLSPDDCRELERRMKHREFPPQATIIREGGPGNAAFFILSGVVAVRRKDPTSGIEFLLSELRTGQMFGEMALITRKPRNASVVAVEATTCAVLEDEDFRRVVEEHPSICLALIAVLAERVEAANRQVGIDFVNLSRVQIDPRVLTLLPQPLVTEHHVLPIAFMNNRLTLAMTNPNDVVAFDDVRRVIKGVIIEPAGMPEDELRDVVHTTCALAGAQPDAAARPPSPRRDAGEVKTAASVDLLQSD